MKNHLCLGFVESCLYPVKVVWQIPQIYRNAIHVIILGIEIAKITLHRPHYCLYLNHNLAQVYTVRLDVNVIHSCTCSL